MTEDVFLGLWPSDVNEYFLFLIWGDMGRKIALNLVIMSLTSSLLYS